MHTKSSVVKSNDEGVVISTPQGVKKPLPADGIITSIGYIANNRIYEELKDMISRYTISEIPTGYIISWRSGMSQAYQEISDTVKKTGQCDPFLLFFLQTLR